MSAHATPEDLAMSREQRVVACRRALALLLIHHGAKPPDRHARDAVRRLRHQIGGSCRLNGPKLSKAARATAARKARHSATVDDLAHMREISAAVMAFYGLTENELFSHRRHGALARARQEIMYRAAKETRLSLPQIGQFLDRDHTTVLHGIARHAERLGLAPARGPLDQRKSSA